MLTSMWSIVLSHEEETDMGAVITDTRWCFCSWGTRGGLCFNCC